MDPLATISPISKPPDNLALQREIRALRLTLHITLASLLIFAGSVGIYIFRQASILRRQVDSSTRSAAQLSQYYTRVLGPQSQAFEKKLQEFALNHPDFRARLARFYAPPAGQTNAAPTSPAEPAAPPVPGNP